MGDEHCLGIAVSTIGRPALTQLLASLARSTALPAGVAIANQSQRPLLVDPADYPFPVVVVASSGGVSRGRNDAVQALPPECDVLGFPNDDNLYDTGTFREVLATFTRRPSPDAVACRLEDPEGERFRLPPAGQRLDRRNVWRAVEPATFVRRSCFDALQGFDTDIGTGAGSPWGSGEGTDLLLRLLATGGVVLSRPDLTVLGAGERRQLDPDALVAKHRAYARGTGHVYRLHGYPVSSRLRILAGPWVRPRRHAPGLQLSLRLAFARTLGRAEGLLDRPLGELARRRSESRTR